MPRSPVTTPIVSRRACRAALAAIAFASGCTPVSVAPSSASAGRAAPAVGRAIPNAYFCVEREPGTYEIATVAEPDRRFAQGLAGGETRYVRLDFTVTWFLIAHINPVPVASDVGAAEIEGLHEMR